MLQLTQNCWPTTLTLANPAKGAAGKLNRLSQQRSLEVIGTLNHAYVGRAST